MVGARSRLVLVLICVAAGLLGMALFEATATVYQDWVFLHRARLVQEYQQAHPQPSQPSSTQAK